MLDKLGLPKDLLRNIAIALLFVIATILVVPQLGVLIERPLQRLSRAPCGDLGGGFLLGCALGLVFVPCAGPVLGFVTARRRRATSAANVAAHVRLRARAAAVVLLASRSAASASAAAARRVERFRAAFGVAVALATLALVFNLDTRLQTWLPN